MGISFHLLRQRVLEVDGGVSIQVCLPLLQRIFKCSVGAAMLLRDMFSPQHQKEKSLGDKLYTK